MNKNKIFIPILFAALLMVGCSDFLEKLPDDMRTGETVWSSRSETEAYLYNVYSQIPAANLYQDDPWLGCSDEIDLSWNVYNTYQINLGNWNPGNNFYLKWNSFYKAIRSSFVFENNVDQCKQLSERLIRQYKSEVKFLRGYYYWLLLRQYGPFVLIEEEMPASSNWNIPRSSYDECVDYIVRMMEEAETDLPDNWQSDRNWLGKPNKMVCKAVKAEVLTMAASPQWNGNAAYASFKNQDGKALVSTTYDESKWRRAAAASKAVIDIAESGSNVKLYKNHENGNGTVFSAFKSVRDVHLASWNCEIIWGKSRFNYVGWEVHTSPSPNNLGGVGPTQRVVDAFLMENGKWIEDPNAGYVDEGFTAEGGPHWNPKNWDLNSDRVQILNSIRSGETWGHWPGDWAMYANREPRFYASILYNKRIIPQIATDVAKRNYYSTPNQANGYGRVELYYGGKSRLSGSTTFYPRTGYLCLKNVDFQSNMRDREYGSINRHESFIRYAKVLLDYIEALNEYDPGNTDIEKYWNMIRERAGVPKIFTVYPEIRGNKQAQLEHILRERQIELCFETDRYFTTRRRWLSNTPDNGDPMRKFGEGGKMYGMDINAGSSYLNRFTFTGFYQRVPFEERVFDMKMNIFPIPQNEIDRNKALVQNPGW